MIKQAYLQTTGSGLWSLVLSRGRGYSGHACRQGRYPQVRGIPPPTRQDRTGVPHPERTGYPRTGYACRHGSYPQVRQDRTYPLDRLRCGRFPQDFLVAFNFFTNRIQNRKMSPHMWRHFQMTSQSMSVSSQRCRHFSLNSRDKFVRMNHNLGSLCWWWETPAAIWRMFTTLSKIAFNSSSTSHKWMSLNHSICNVSHSTRWRRSPLRKLRGRKHFPSVSDLAFWLSFGTPIWEEFSSQTPRRTRSVIGCLWADPVASE